MSEVVEAAPQPPDEVREAPGAADGRIARQRPCRCGYDLRGLDPHGRCPECGLEIVSLLIATADAGAPVAPAEPGWKRRMRDAAVLALLAQTAAYVMAYLRMDLFSWRNPPRWAWTLEAYLLAASAWWGLQWYATLRLTGLEHGRQTPARERVVAWALRVLATMFAVAPFLADALRNAVFRNFDLLVVVARSLAMLTAVAFYLRVRDVLRRLGAPGVAGQATLLAVLLPFVMWASRAWFEWHGGAYSLDYFASIPSYQSGDATGLTRFVQDLTDRWPGAYLAGEAAIAVGCWVVLGRLLVVVWRSRSEPVLA